MVLLMINLCLHLAETDDWDEIGMIGGHSITSIDSKLTCFHVAILLIVAYYAVWTISDALVSTLYKKNMKN